MTRPIPLLLAGGLSSRMGSRKELLELVDGIPIYEQQLIRLRLACPESEAIFLSLPNSGSLTAILENPRVTRVAESTFHLLVIPSPIVVHLLYDRTPQQGPAGGLLAAHHHDPNATWLVVACDYPFLSVSALRQLREEFAGPVTCFENSDGIYEPLLGIWSSSALSLLQENVAKGILGPKSVVLKSKGKGIRPRKDVWLFNMNTPAEFEQAQGMHEEIGAVEQDIEAWTSNDGR